MAQSISPSSKLSYLKPDDKPAAEHRSSALGETPTELTNEQHLESDSRDNNPNPDDLLSGEGKSWTQWAVDQVKYVADGVASKKLSDELLPKEPKEGDDKTWSQWATENAVAAKDVAALNAIKVRNTASSNVQYVKDAAASKLPGSGAPAAYTSSSDYDMASGNKKSVSRTLVDTGVGFKDNVANRLRYAADQSSQSAADSKQSVQDLVDRYSTTTRTPEVGQTSFTKALIDTGLGLKDGIATQLGYGPNPDTPAAARAASIREQTVHRATALKDSTMSKFAPGEGEKDLSQTITGSLSNLPTLLKERVWVYSNSPKAITQSDDIPLSTNSSSSQENSTTTPPAGGLGNLVAGVVSSATGVVSSYLPTTVAAYLPGRKSPEQENLDPTSETTSSTEVTFEEKLNQIGPEKLMELWTIGSGNGTLDWTLNTGTVETDSCISPRSPKTPKSAFSAAGPQSPKTPKLAYSAAGPQSPKTPKSAYSAGVMPTNVKAEAIAEAHRARVKVEANAYLEAELRKAEAHALKMHAKAEKHRLDEEAKALETLKKEELRAGLLVHNAEVKVEKLVTQSKSKAVSIGVAAEEQYANNIADAKTKAERWKAEIEEAKLREMAELRERVEQMILMEELPAPPEHKGVVQKVKDELVHKVKEKVCHLRGH